MGRIGFTSILLVKGNVTIDTMLQFDLDLHGHGDGEVIFKLEIFVRRSKSTSKFEIIFLVFFIL